MRLLSEMPAFYAGMTSYLPAFSEFCIINARVSCRTLAVILFPTFVTENSRGKRILRCISDEPFLAGLKRN